MLYVGLNYSVGNRCVCSFNQRIYTATSRVLRKPSPMPLEKNRCQNLQKQATHSCRGEAPEKSLFKLIMLVKFPIKLEMDGCSHTNPQIKWLTPPAAKSQDPQQLQALSPFNQRGTAAKATGKEQPAL